MMAFDRTRSGPTLERDTVEALRTALTAAVDRGKHESELRDLLCKATAEARQKGIPPERLLIALKDIWYALPNIATTTPSDVEHTLLQELISRCIEEYYSA